MSWTRGYLVDLFGEPTISALDERQMKRHIRGQDCTHCLTLNMAYGLANAHQLFSINPAIKQLQVFLDKNIAFKQQRITMVNNLMELLKFNTTVSRLLFYNATDKEVEALGNILKENRFITSVNVGVEGVEPCVKGFIALAEALRINTTISSLSLNYTYSKRDTRGMEELLNALSVNKYLKTLKVKNMVNPPVLLQLASVINCTLITHLEINVAKFDRTSLERFAQAMIRNKTIIYLKVYSHTSSVRDVGEVLLRAISCNRSVRTLNLTARNLMALSSVFQLIKVNPTVSELMCYNSFRNDSLEMLELAKILKCNDTITKLHMTLDNGSPECIPQCIANALDTNYTLQSISFLPPKTRPTLAFMPLPVWEGPGHPLGPPLDLPDDPLFDPPVGPPVAPLFGPPLGLPVGHPLGPPLDLPNNPLFGPPEGYPLRHGLGPPVRHLLSHSVSQPVREEMETNPALLRNKLIFKMAVHFVLKPSLNRQEADSYEKTRRSSALITALKKCRKTEKEAACLINAANNWISSRFFVVSNIVKERLECFDKGNVTQLDDLSNDVIRLICSYLKLSDVL